MNAIVRLATAGRDAEAAAAFMALPEPLPGRDALRRLLHAGIDHACARLILAMHQRQVAAGNAAGAAGDLFGMHRLSFIDQNWVARAVAADQVEMLAGLFRDDEMLAKTVCAHYVYARPDLLDTLIGGGRLAILYDSIAMNSTKDEPALTAFLHRVEIPAEMVRVSLSTSRAVAQYVIERRELTRAELGERFIGMKRAEAALILAQPWLAAVPRRDGDVLVRDIAAVTGPLFELRFRLTTFTADQIERLLRCRLPSASMALVQARATEMGIAHP